VAAYCGWQGGSRLLTTDVRDGVTDRVCLTTPWWESRRESRSWPHRRWPCHQRAFTAGMTAPERTTTDNTMAGIACAVP
jgi:hypothetical protein